MAKVELKADAEESNRMWASASFVGVLIIIGLPLWWKTTEVYRVALPYDKINAFDTQPLYVTSELTVLANNEPTATKIAEHIKKTFQDTDVLHLKVRTEIMTKDLQSKLARMDEEGGVKAVAEHFDLEKHNTFYVAEKNSLPHEVWLGMERIAFFRDVKAGAPGAQLARALRRWVYEPGALEGARSAAADGARRTRAAPHGAYHVTLSVARPPHVDTLRFDAKAAVEDYIGSFVDELSDLHNFTLNSQWLHLLDFDFQAREVKASPSRGAHWAVRAERLPQLLTRAEGRAAHVSPLPALHLLLYAVPCRLAPLLIYDADDKPVTAPVQAFMSPKWGGVVLWSPTPEQCSSKPHYEPDTRLVMGAFLAHLRVLLGITNKEPVGGAQLQRLRGVAPRRWERDALLRLRALEQLAAARAALRSLATLLGSISNIVITEEVGASITEAVESVQRGSALLAGAEGALGAEAPGAERGGPEALRRAYWEAQRALRAADYAFLHPSLLALLYFPDDQKYAIYIPLFLPIMVPVILSLKNLTLWFRGKPLHKEDKEKTD